MSRFQVTTNVLMLVFLIINLAYLYKLTVELHKANEQLEDVEEVVDKVKLAVADLEKVYVSVKELEAPAKDLYEDMKRKLDEVELEDVLKDFLEGVEKKGEAKDETAIETD